MLRKKYRLETVEFDQLYETIGEGPDKAVLAKVLEATDSIDGLMETPEFWSHRISQGQALVTTINTDWNANLSARMKADYLLSDRDLVAMRVDWSNVLVNNKPRPKVALVNPFKVYDPQQRVFFPEPITKKSRSGGWVEVIKNNMDRFGLITNPEHVDCTERDFDLTLQKLIDRDAHLLLAHEDLKGKLTAVIGFDGAADFCHACVRLVDYKEGVSKESEMKAAGLTVAVGDDHNFNLNLQFRRVGPAINHTIRTGGKFMLRCVPIIVEINNCLDYSASRSLYAKRTNSSPHSLKLHPHLIIDTPAEAEWPIIDATIDEAMPWCPSPADTCGKLNHLFSSFPARCDRCPYKVGSEAEQDANIAMALAMRSVKTKAGKKAWAARVAVH